ncbi:HmuY family protein [Aureivirga sp. CE67]|uniref:HmuY family protein n=1 Tax=Aureivirga sp. CE67 TaxID=1788983 RepID=UPI0018C9F6CD|nr:HmuY family protein [Aureivirga sp. CE67]
MKKNNLFLSFLLIAFISFSFVSCSDDDDNTQTVDPVDPAPTELELKKVENLHAPNDVIDYATGQVIEEKPFNYFSFEEGGLVDESANWDIAFKGTTIITNSGISGDGSAMAVVLDGIFNEVLEAPEDADFREDTEAELAVPKGGGNGWYNYNPQSHQITPIPGKVIVIKTDAGKYAKMEILSYYKDNPATIDETSESAYYTFNYKYQTGDSKSLK